MLESALPILSFWSLHFLIIIQGWTIYHTDKDKSRVQPKQFQSILCLLPSHTHAHTQTHMHAHMHTFRHTCTHTDTHCFGFVKSSLYYAVIILIILISACLFWFRGTAHGFHQHPCPCPTFGFHRGDWDWNPWMRPQDSCSQLWGNFSTPGKWADIWIHGLLISSIYSQKEDIRTLDNFQHSGLAGTWNLETLISEFLKNFNFFESLLQPW